MVEINSNQKKLNGKMNVGKIIRPGKIISQLFPDRENGVRARFRKFS